MKFLSISVMLVMALAAMVLIAGQLGFLRGQMPQTIGIKDGRLQPPSLTPNSVSSQAGLYPDHPRRDDAKIKPLAYSGDADAAMARLVSLLQNTDRTMVIVSESDYVYAQSSTALLKFTDDLEFWLDRKNSVIQVRSASRLGKKDFGTNRARVESIRARFGP